MKKKLSGTTTNQRKHLQQSLMIALLKHGRICTTLATAKAIRPYVEKEITRAKVDTLQNRRIFMGHVYNQQNVVKLMYEKIAPGCINRPGGYLRVIKYLNHRTDAAPTAIIEFVDFDNIYGIIV